METVSSIMVTVILPSAASTKSGLAVDAAGRVSAALSAYSIVVAPMGEMGFHYCIQYPIRAIFF